MENGSLHLGVSSFLFQGSQDTSRGHNARCSQSEKSPPLIPSSVDALSSAVSLYVGENPFFEKQKITHILST